MNAAERERERENARVMWETLFNPEAVAKRQWLCSIEEFIARYLRMRNSCDILSQWISRN